MVTIRIMGDDSEFWESVFDGGDDQLRFIYFRVGPTRTTYRWRLQVNTNEDLIGRDELYAILELISVPRPPATPEIRSLRTPVVTIG
jgi:hypothetical protein